MNLSTSMPSHAAAGPGLMGQWPWAFLAVAVPTLLAANDPPSVTFYNQVLSVFGWGVWMSVLRRHGQLGAAVPSSAHPANPALMALSMVLWLCAGTALGSSVWGQLPLGLGLMAAALSLSAWLVMSTASQSAWRLGSVQTLDVVAEALAVTGVAGLALGFLQVFIPSWTDGLVIAETSTAGRAVGNLRQPNHLSTLLIWSVCGGAWLGRRRLWAWPLASLLVVVGIGGVVWTASRTGMLGMGLLTLWALRDKHLPRPLRALLILAPVLYAAWWGGMAWWAHASAGHAFAAEARLNDGSDISSSRFKIWSDTWQLIQAQPWTGVGWGNFNLAWTFTELPQRPVAFFDHTHNVILQWAVELGIPLALLLTGLTAWGLIVLWLPWRALPDGDSEDRGHGVGQDEHLRLGVVSLAGTVAAMAALHSLLEYPLWYSYFLLPLAFVWGLGLAARVGAPLQMTPVMQATHQPPASHLSWRASAPAIMMALAAVWCAIDYQWAANIYAPRPGTQAPLAQRIESGQHRLWFGYQADYAHVTAPDDDEPSERPQAFMRTLHNLVDSRLMIAYARSLAEHGQVDKARYIVARLKEFKSRQGLAFVAACDQAPPSGPQRPFQCDPPQGRYTWREVLPDALSDAPRTQ